MISNGEGQSPPGTSTNGKESIAIAAKFGGIFPGLLTISNIVSMVSFQGSICGYTH